MARWKARGRLYSRCNWTFSAISYDWDVMSGNRSKLAFFDGGWVTLSADFRGKGASPTNQCWCQKTSVIAVSCGIKIFALRCLVLSQYTHLTDRQDRIATTASVLCVDKISCQASNSHHATVRERSCEVKSCTSIYLVHIKWTRSSATEEIAHNVDKTAVQGHSRSSDVVPIDTAYVTLY